MDVRVVCADSATRQNAGGVKKINGKFNPAYGRRHGMKLQFDSIKAETD